MSPQIVIMSDAEVERFEKEEGLGGLLTDKGPLPLKGLDVQARIDGLISEVTLTQTFVNTHAEMLEATYIFPLPDRAAVTAFRMEVAGRVIEGVLKERAAARKEYDEAIEAGHRAAITEEERPNVFTMRVGNLPPGEKAVVRLTMVGPLVCESGEATFRFPLVVAPRYIPGNPLDGRSVGDGLVVDTDAVPDASRITPPVLLPGYPNPVQFSMTVDVQPAGLTLHGFRSSLHTVVIEHATDGATQIRVQPGERVNRDFILRYQIGEANIQSSLTLVPDSDKASAEGTFVLTVIPPIENQESRTKNPRDVVFVLDRSGSMDGWKMVAARRALGRMIDTLTSQDRFTVLAFDDSVEVPELCAESLINATDRNRFRAIEWLAQIEARGGTEMAQPLDAALSQLSGDDQRKKERVLVLLTDGQVGNEDQILKALAQRLKGIRVFTLGIDQAVNEAFLRRLAALGGGSCDVVESEDRLDEVMNKVQRRIGAPLWTGLRLETTGLEIIADSQVPSRLPDVFPGVPLTVFGRFHGSAKGKLKLLASDDAGQQVKQTVKSHVSANPALTKLWARGRLRDLDDRWVIADADSKESLRLNTTALSLKFGVLCRFTAFVAVDRTEVVNVGGKQQNLTQPVELPQGWTVPEFGVGSLSSTSKAQYLMSASAALSADWDMLEGDGGEFDCYLDGANEEPTNGNGGAPHDEEEEQVVPLTEELDLSAYRRRAAEILEQLRADSDINHALGVLMLQLEALVDDLKSIGADTSVTASLAKLLGDLHSSRLQDAAALSCAEQVLKEFAEIHRN